MDEKERMGKIEKERDKETSGATEERNEGRVADKSLSVTEMS